MPLEEKGEGIPKDERVGTKAQRQENGKVKLPQPISRSFE